MAGGVIITRDAESNSVKINPLRESTTKITWLSLIYLEIIKAVVQIKEANIYSKPKGKVIVRPKIYALNNASSFGQGP